MGAEQSGPNCKSEYWLNNIGNCSLNDLEGEK